MTAAPAARPSRIRYRVLTWLCVIAAIAYLQRNSISVLKEPLAEDLDLEPAALGAITAAFYLGYALFQIPGGLLRDLWGTRATMAVVGLIGTLAMLLMASVYDVRLAWFAWLLVGACQAALFPCAISAIRHWFPATQRATASGILAACMSLGGAISTGVAGYLLGPLDWRSVLALFAIPAAVWSILFAIFYRSRPELHSSVNDAERALIHGSETPTSAATVDTVHGPTPWLTILFTPTLIFLYFQQCFRAAGQVFYGTWFPTYLQDARGVTLADSGWLTSLPQLALMCGALLGGIVSDRLLRQTGSHRVAYQGVSIISLTICAVLILGSYGIASATLAVIVISIGQFFGALAGPAAYAVSIEKGGRHLATVFSTMNMAGNLGAMALPWVLPKLVAATSWTVALGMFASLYGLAALCWLAIKPGRAIGE
ncbi:MAG: MFS transporter [Planctomycetaceae bacterium]|nr:MFS transporter [Planctomycetaceae bacterium]